MQTEYKLTPEEQKLEDKLQTPILCRRQDYEYKIKKDGLKRTYCGLLERDCQYRATRPYQEIHYRCMLLEKQLR